MFGFSLFFIKFRNYYEIIIEETDQFDYEKNDRMLNRKGKNAYLKTEFQVCFCSKNVCIFQPLLNMVALANFFNKKGFAASIKSLCKSLIIFPKLISKFIYTVEFIECI